MADNQDFAAEAVDRMLPRIPATLYEVAWQYSLLDWYATMQSGDIDFELSPEHLAYLTPRAKNDLFGEQDSLVVVYVDLSDLNNPKLVDRDNGPIEITSYTESDSYRVGHAYPANKTSSMTDYSITTYKNADAHHIAGLRDDAWGTNNVQDRFTDWAQSEFANRVQERVNDEDVAILEGLAKLGDDDNAMKQLSEALIDQAGGEDVELDVLITVKIQLPGESRFRFPGEIPVLNEVMVEKKSERLENISVSNASGKGTPLLSNNTADDSPVTGGSPGLFGMYGKKQREHFPDLDVYGESAWRTRPLDFDMAAAIAAADSIFDDFYQGLRNSRRLYVLPYIARRAADCTGDDFNWFFETVYTALRDVDREGFDEQVEPIIRRSTQTEIFDGHFDDDSHQAWDSVRIASVLMITGNPDRVFFDTLDAGYYPGKLEDAHNEVLDHSIFRDDGIFANNPDPEYSPLLGSGLRLHRYILYGGYFQRTAEPTPSSKEAQDTPTAGDIDDYRMTRVGRIITGRPLPLSELLDHYLNKLVQEQRDEFGQDSNYPSIPTRSIVEQYVQLQALAKADLLQTTNGTALSFTRKDMTTTESNRDDKLEQFLDSHDALSESHHRATFLLGALVGRITAYQSRENISSTLVRRYPIDYLTIQTIKEVTKEVLQQDAEYAEAEERRSYWTNSRYTTRLADMMLSTDPQSWSITDAELQWLYALGMAYGLNDTDTSSDVTATATTTMNNS